MIKAIFLVVAIFTCSLVNGQVNMVLNPDFESYSQCPDNADQISRAYYWSGVDSIGNTTCVPEYCHTCGTYVFITVPLSNAYYQVPHSGNGFAHVQVFFDESFNMPFKRDYLQGRLKTNLEDGVTYCVSFYVNLAEDSRYAIENIGAYFDDGSIDTTSTCNLPQTQYTPQVQNPLGIITDTANWVKIQGTFMANGSEKFITIGNFYDFANTNYLEVPNDVNFSITYTWYLIDDVSVIPSDLPAYAGNDTLIGVGDSAFIGRTPEIGLECKWYQNGSLIDSGAGIWVHPTVTTTYVVEQTLCGLVKTDTVTVEVWPAGVAAINYAKYVTVYPNPATTELTIKMDKAIFSSFRITNSIGQQQLSQLLTTGETRVDISALPAGVYYLTLERDSGKEVRKFVKM